MRLAAVSPLCLDAEEEIASPEQSHIDRRVYRHLSRALSRAYERLGACRGRWARRRPGALLLAGHQPHRLHAPASPDLTASGAHHRIGARDGATGRPAQY